MEQMVANERTYEIEEVKRINIRYYLVKIAGKSYILDFANSRSIKNYFPVYFLNMSRRWQIYDVTGNESIYDAKPLPWYLDQKKEWISLPLALIYLSNIAFFPDYLNIGILTKDTRIAEYRETTLLFILVGAVIVFIWLFFRPTTIPLPDTAKELVLANTPPLDELVFGFLGTPLFVGSGLVVGIFTSTYATLLTFAVYPLYLVLFGKFWTFLKPTNIYYMREKKQK